MSSSVRLTPLKHRWGIVRSAKRCPQCILGLVYSSRSKLESQTLTQCSVCSVHCTPYSTQLLGSRGCVSNSGTLASKRTTSLCLSQNTSSLHLTNEANLLTSNVHYWPILVEHTGIHSGGVSTITLSKTSLEAHDSTGIPSKKYDLLAQMWYASRSCYREGLLTLWE